MAQAQNGDTVEVHDAGKLEDGGVFCSSSNQGPMQFKPGEGRVCSWNESMRIQIHHNPTGRGIWTAS